MYLLKDIDDIKQNIISYYDNKIEIDYFIELYGEFYFKSLMCELKDINPSLLLFENIKKLHEYKIDMLPLAYIHLGFYESYLRSMIYRSTNEKENNLKEKVLPTLFEIEEELDLKLVPCDFNKAQILKFRRQVMKYEYLTIEEMNQNLMLLKSLLPESLKNILHEDYKRLKQKHCDILSLIRRYYEKT